MHDCRKIEESLIDLVFNELTEDRRRQTLAQVESCPRCRAQYEAYQATLSTFDEVADLMAPGEDYWAGYEARLRVKLAAGERLTWGEQFAEAIRNFLRHPGLGFSLASLVLLALTSLYVFRFSPAIPGNTPRQTADEIASAIPSIKEKTRVNIPQPSPAFEAGHKRKVERQVIARAVKSGPKEQRRITKEPAITEGQTSLIASVIDAETRRHFERTQMLLRAFRNLRLADDDVTGEITDEKRRSRALLFQNILLRREAETRGVLPVQQVLSEVEPLLIDIANLPDKATPDEIRAVRERVQKKEIVATLQGYLAVVSSQ